MSALDHARDKVLAASASGRNNALYGQARWCFEIAAGGGLEFEQAWEYLTQVGREVGLDKAEIRSTLKSAEREGRKKPKKSKRSGSRDDVPEPVIIPPEEPVYPPHHVWTALWNAAEGVFVHDAAVDWLIGRGIDLERLSGAGLCRFLPNGTRFPKDLHDELRNAISRVAIDGVWKPAPHYGFRLLFRLYDCLGNPRSLQLRTVIDHGEKLKAKAVPLKPQKRGLVLANRWGVVALQRDPMRKELWADRHVEYVIVEGEPDLLAASCEDTGDDRVRVVFGITGGGSWSTAVADAIPQDARVIIATDDDGPGNNYAMKIRDTLNGRRVSRWKPIVTGEDVSDAGGLGGGLLQ